MITTSTMRGRQAHSDTRRRGALAVAGLLAAATLTMACGPDAQGKFEEFVEQTRESEGATSQPVTTGAGTTEAATEPATTSATTGPSTGDTDDTDGPPPIDISGDFLLAVSTTVDKSKPLQFVATTIVTTAMDASQTMSVCLQPLTLMQGKVTVPRQPIGEPLCFKDLAIVDGAFTIDAGTVMVTGMANPITGANITASLLMAGEIKDADFFCGTVNGEVMEPPIGSIEGSTFAAVRLTDKTVLPTDVVINCKKMPTVTDPP